MARTSHPALHVYACVLMMFLIASWGTKCPES